VSFNRNRCGGIAAAFAGGLAPAGSHIALPVLARGTAWTGGRPEKLWLVLQRASLLPAHISGCDSGPGAFDPDSQRRLQTGYGHSPSAT
jgi:hypothetical protein